VSDSNPAPARRAARLLYLRAHIAGERGEPVMLSAETTTKLAAVFDKYARDGCPVIGAAAQSIIEEST
jgi:hypothetical protein